MENSNWFKINREIFNSDIWQDVTTFRLFFYLIGKASHRDGFKYRGLILNEGQYVCSYRKLADELSYREGRGYKNYSLQTIKNSINKLIDAERVNVKRTKYGTLFTIVNYAKYQRSERFVNDKVNTFNEEPQTLSERTVNVNRTNTEQYQELKNLRTKELKNNKTTKANMHACVKNSDVIIFYEQNFGELKPYIKKDLLIWINDLSEKLVIEAMKRALERNVVKWGYVKSILKSWKKKKIRTIEQAKSEELSFRKKRKSKTEKLSNKKQVNNEVIPDWFKNRDKEISTQNKLTVEEEQEVKALLQKHI